MVCGSNVLKFFLFSELQIFLEFKSYIFGCFYGYLDQDTIWYLSRSGCSNFWPVFIKTRFIWKTWLFIAIGAIGTIGAIGAIGTAVMVCINVYVRYLHSRCRRDIWNSGDGVHHLHVRYLHSRF